MNGFATRDDRRAVAFPASLSRFLPTWLTRAATHDRMTSLGFGALAVDGA